MIIHIIKTICYIVIKNSINSSRLIVGFAQKRVNNAQKKVRDI